MDQLSRVFKNGIDSILAALLMFSIVVCPNVTFGVTCNRLSHNTRKVLVLGNWGGTRCVDDLFKNAAAVQKT